MATEFGFGSGLLYATRNDLTTQTPLRFGAFQDLSIDITGDIKQLYGQTQYPLDVARGKSKIECKAKFVGISAVQFNAVFFGGTIATGQTLSAYQEVGSIPGTPYTVTVSNSATWTTDLGVRFSSTGLPLTLVTGTPTTGQYSVAAGVYTFAAADTLKGVLIDYLYTAVTGYTMALVNPLMGNAPRFQADFTQSYEGLEYTFHFPRCVATKLTMPSKLDDYTMPELDFSIYADPSGNIMTMTAAQ